VAREGAASRRRFIRCDDGHRIDGATDDELVANAESHFRAAHPLLVGQLSRREILSMVVTDNTSGSPARQDPSM
jgi:hypothetical protein